MGSSSSTQTSQNNNTNYNGSTSSAPGWAPQVNALTAAFGQAPGALAQAQSYKGPNGVTAGLEGNAALSNTGQALGSNAATAAQSGLGALSGFNAVDANNPQSIINAANQYVQGQNIQAQTDAAMQQAKELARDVTLPGISQNAAISGNSDSSRAGIAQGLVERSLAENAQNTYNSLAGQAYNQGLGLAQNQAQANNAANLQAYNAAAGQGTNAAIAGSNLYGQALNNVGTANAINQGNFQSNVNNAYAALQPYMQLFGNTNWGSTNTASGSSQSNGTGTSNTQNDPGLLSNISSGLGLLGAFL